MNVQTTASPISVIREVSFEDIRRTIDQVDTVRAGFLRMAHHGMLLYHLAPSTAMTDEVRAQLFVKLDEQLVVIRSATGMLRGRIPFPETSRLISDWFPGIAATRPKDLQLIGALVKVSERVAKAARLGNGEQQATLAANIEMPKGGVCQRTTELRDAFENDPARQEAARLVTAHGASKALGGCLNCLVRIGQQFRLVSLNASAQAACVGTVGKGLMINAREFKSLVKEIRSLSQQARTETVTPP